MMETLEFEATEADLKDQEVVELGEDVDAWMEEMLAGPMEFNF